MTKSLLLINGPNLNMLGKRETSLYGSETLDSIVDRCGNLARSRGLDFAHFQSNSEGAIVDEIQRQSDLVDAIVINGAAYSHTSIAILDALRIFDGLVIELHISNIFARESFRHFTYLSARADAVMAGFGSYGYDLAVLHVARHLDS